MCNASCVTLYLGDKVRTDDWGEIRNLEAGSMRYVYLHWLQERLQMHIRHLVACALWLAKISICFVSCLWYKTHTKPSFVPPRRLLRRACGPARSYDKWSDSCRQCGGLYYDADLDWVRENGTNWADIVSLLLGSGETTNYFERYKGAIIGVLCCA
jgi:hypothetical protein